MNIEIERKFLVTGEYKQLANKSYRIAQGYLSSAPGRTVRIRIKGEKGFITIKGNSNKSGLSRFEWEKEIDLSDARQLLLLCENGIIDKTRYEIVFSNKTFEVDEFHGDNEGLTIAELELTSENELFKKPEWLGEEITGNKRYYNSYLSKNAYKNW
ncbi:MAG: CYTH domain-containing protein [Bacteroidales bacterium]|nr:CYTH domain-containing protein [Bacteroidales bacterium]